MRGELDPFSRRRRIRDAARAVVTGAAGRAPQLIVVEDLHWIDEDTQAVLDDIVEAARRAPIHLVVTYRPEFDDPWTGRPDHDRIQLEPLHGRAAGQLLGALLGDDPSVARLREVLLARTGGTPLFVEETVRALATAARSPATRVRTASSGIRTTWRCRTPCGRWSRRGSTGWRPTTRSCCRSRP